MCNSNNDDFEYALPMYKLCEHVNLSKFDMFFQLDKNGRCFINWLISDGSINNMLQ